MNENSKIGIDLFCGAGGLSLGAELAGIKIVLANEKNNSAAETFRYNHPNVKLIKDDIRNFKLSDHNIYNPFVVMGGPPCQGFSISNTLTRNDSNKNNHLFLEFVRIISESKPEWFVFENVEGIVSYKNGETVTLIKELFTDLGYNTAEDVLYASDYGVPQNRNRFFMVGNNKGIDFCFPEKFKNKITVREAFIDLPDLENGQKSDSLPYKDIELTEYALNIRNGATECKQNLVTENQPHVLDRYKYIKPGQNWRAIPKELMKNYKEIGNCHSGIYKRLDPDKPSVVISNFRKNMLIHPFQDRGLSIREAARIQSFPDTFIFKGYFSHQQQQIGNAVPPLLAKAIFSQIILQNSMHEKKDQEITVEV